jgi:hypothetical protein
VGVPARYVGKMRMSFAAYAQLRTATWTGIVHAALPTQAKLVRGEGHALSSPLKRPMEAYSMAPRSPDCTCTWRETCESPTLWEWGSSGSRYKQGSAYWERALPNMPHTQGVQHANRQVQGGCPSPQLCMLGLTVFSNSRTLHQRQAGVPSALCKTATLASREAGA